VDLPFRIPGTTEPEIVVRRSALGGVKVLVGGTPIKGSRRRYAIPMEDGSVKELRLAGQWTGLKAVVDGVETPLEPRIPPILVVLGLLPIALAAIGGLIGGVVGGVAAVINIAVARSPIRTPIKVASILAVGVLAVVVYFVAAIAFTVLVVPVPTYEVGACVNGIGEGTRIGRDNQPVACGSPHDNEVVGSVEYTGQAGYPGQPTLETFAESSCIAAFNAYVGGDFQTSSLNMLPILPSELSWARGDRTISCVVVTGDGSKLAGSVKGTGR